MIEIECNEGIVFVNPKEVRYIQVLHRSHQFPELWIEWRDDKNGTIIVFEESDTADVALKWARIIARLCNPEIVRDF